MNEQLEKLIDLALADGQLTEKERSVILKKAAELGVDRDEIEVIIDGRLHQVQQQSSKPTKEKVGNVRTCPSCGGSVAPLSAKCSDCGHEFANVKASSSVQKLFDELQKVTDIERSRPVPGYWHGGVGAQDLAVLQRQMAVISTYPIPNGREDLLEFIAIALAESQKSVAAHDGLAHSLVNAWNAKGEQAIIKANLIFKDDASQIEYLKQCSQILTLARKKHSVNKIKPLLFSILAFVAIFAMVGTAWYFGGSEKRQERQRLENIELQINNAVESKDYDRAILLTDQLAWTLDDDINRRTGAPYEAKRKSLRESIEKMKLENARNNDRK